jgi:hypothetical protein
VKRVKIESDLNGLTAGTKSTARFALQQGKPVFIANDDDDVEKTVIKMLKSIEEAKKKNG